MRFTFWLLLALLLAAVTLKAQHSYSSLRDSLNRQPADTQRVHLLLELSEAGTEEGRYEEVRKFLEEARALSDSLSFDYGRAAVLLRRGDLGLIQQNIDSAQAVLEEGLNQYPDSRLRPQFLNLLATAYQYRESNLQALETYREALALLDTTRQRQFASRLKMNMAGIYADIGNKSRSFRYYLDALEQAEAAGDSVFLAVVLNNVGNAYNNDEQFEEAGYYLERSWELSETLDYDNGRLLSATNLGNTHSGMGELQEARKWYERALEVHPRVRAGPPVQLYYNLGNLHGRMGDLDRSEELFRQSLENSRSAGMEQGMFFNGVGLGTVASRRGDDEEAVRWYREALRAADSLNSLDFRQQAHHHLYEQYQGMGRPDSALAHLERSKQLSDSLSAREQEQMLAEAEARMGLRRQEELNRALREKQAEQQSRITFQYWLIVAVVCIMGLALAIAYLVYRESRQRRRLNRQLQQQKQKLEELNRVKDKLFAVVAHDLRNPITALRGMLHMLRDEQYSREELKELSEELEISLHQNMTTLENLLAWARSQMEGITIRTEEVNAGSLAEDLVASHLFQAHRKGIELVNAIADDITVRADREMLKLVLRNLISNALKFSEEGDEIRLVAGTSNGQVEIRVSDTGIGIPPEVRKDLFTQQNHHRQGTRNERGSGLGLALCKEFIELQDGSITFDTEVGQGTTFRLVLPGNRGQ